MPWLAAVAAVGSAIYTAANNSKRKGYPDTPSYQTDPVYSGQQDFLKQYSQDIMKGNIPDYYKAIGEPMGSDVKNNYIQEALSSIIGGDQARAAAQGTGRSGSLGSDTMASLGNTSAQLQFADYLRAMQGKEDLLGLGTSLGVDVRNSAFGNQEDMNNFANMEWNNQVKAQEYKNKLTESNTSNWANVFTSVGNLGGGYGGILNSLLSNLGGNKNQTTPTSTDSNQLSMLSNYGNIQGQGSDSLLKQYLDILNKK